MDEEVLNLRLDQSGQNLVDVKTGTVWDVAWGIGRAGSLQGQTLLRVPYLSSFD